MTKDAYEKANKLRERISTLEMLKKEIASPFYISLAGYFKRTLFRCLIPEHIYRKKYYDILYKLAFAEVSYEEEFANDIVELVDKLVDKYMKENTHQHFVFFSNNGWKTRDKFIDDLKSFLEE